MEDPYWNYPQYESFQQYEAAVVFPESIAMELRTGKSWKSSMPPVGANAGGALGTELEGYTTDNIRKTFGRSGTICANPPPTTTTVCLSWPSSMPWSRGKGVTADDIALEWVRNITYAWSAEEIALKNLKRGIFPPDSARVNNPWNEWIGAQMRGSVCGLAAPGNPRLAASLAWLDGSISHVNNGILGEIFNALLVSLAWTNPSVRDILRQSIEPPQGQEYYSVVQFAQEQCRP